MSYSRKSISSNSTALLNGHGNVVGGTGGLASSMRRSCVEVDADQEGFGSLQGNVDS